MTEIHRTVTHDNNHWDLEKFVRTDDFIGWVVIACHMKEETMRLCKFAATSECNARPCVGCDPHGYSAEEIAEQQRQAAELASDMELLGDDAVTPAELAEYNAEMGRVAFELLDGWQIEAEAQAADAADLQRTQDDARM